MPPHTITLDVRLQTANGSTVEVNGEASDARHLIGVAELVGAVKGPDYTSELFSSVSELLSED